MMKAASTKGIPFKPTLCLRQTDRPKPNPTDVLIEVYASSVNPKDWKLNTQLSSLLPKLGPMSQWNIIGDDLSGKIIEVGREVSNFSVGDEVYGMDMRLRTAACAEYAVIDQDCIAHKPNNMSFNEAAVVPLAGLTALQGFKLAAAKQGDSLAGKKVLVIGASGGVGTFAIQVAKALGANVTGVCSGANSELIKDLGADSQIDYTVSDYKKTKNNFDIIFDVTSYESLSTCSSLMANNGILISTAGDAKAIFNIYRPHFLKGNKSCLPIWVNSNTEDLTALKGLIESGAIKSIIHSEYAFEDIEQAYQQSKTGRSRGKVLIKIKD